MAREDAVGVLGGELAAVVGVARLDDDRAPLRGPGQREASLDVDLLAVEGERPGVGSCEEPAARGVGDEVPRRPGVPELRGRLEQLAPAHVAVPVVEVAAAAEVAAGERVGRRHEVPPRAAVGEVVEGAQRAGELVGLVVRRGERRHEADALGHRGERGEDRERLGAPHDVEVVHVARVLAQAQALGEEEEVELRALGGLGQVHEGREVDVAAGRRVAPHRRVVHAREVGGEVDLALAHAT